MMIFADVKDKLRKDYGIRQKGIDKILKKSHPNLVIPMPALGEVFVKIRDKCGDRRNDVISEMNRLFDCNVVSPIYIKSSEDTFNLAKTFSKKANDDRDQISPMDALIVATAIVDKNCKVLYTTDSTLITDTAISEKMDEWRAQNNYDPLTIKDITEIIGVK